MEDSSVQLFLQGHLFRQNHNGIRFLIFSIKAFILCRFLFPAYSSAAFIATPETSISTKNTWSPIMGSHTANTDETTDGATTIETTTKVHPKRPQKQRNDTMRHQIPSYQSRLDSHARHYYMSYACERDHLQLSCDRGHVLLIVRANYGRHSFSTCPHSTKQRNAMCPGSFIHPKKVLHRVCTGRQNCTVHVSWRIFGDPCPKVSKYLEVYFGCVKDENSTDDK